MVWVRVFFCARARVCVYVCVCVCAGTLDDNVGGTERIYIH